MQLPQGQDPAKKPDAADDVIVSIKDDESLHLSGGGTSVEGVLQPDQLESQLKELYERAPSTPLYIKADKRLTYGIVKKAMLRCEAAGFKSVALVAEAPQ